MKATYGIEELCFGMAMLGVGEVTHGRAAAAHPIVVLCSAEAWLRVVG